MCANLIVGFDGSDAGRDGVALARRPAPATGARVRVVYARALRSAAETAEVGLVVTGSTHRSGIGRIDDVGAQLAAGADDR